MQILAGFFSLLNLLTPAATWQVVSHPIAVPVYAQAPQSAPEPTIYELSDQVALAHGIATTSLYNLIKSESSFNIGVKDSDMSIVCPSGVNKGLPVRARGLDQITQCYHPEVTDSEAYDPVFALNYAAEEIKNDKAWQEHTACNCYSYMKTLIPHLPAMKDIVPNIDRPIVGGLVLFNYHGTPHWGYITKITDFTDREVYHIKEANYKFCTIDERDIDSTDPHIVGYWISLWK